MKLKPTNEVVIMSAAASIAIDEIRKALALHSVSEDVTVEREPCCPVCTTDAGQPEFAPCEARRALEDAASAVAAAWDEGFRAAQNYSRELSENDRVLKRFNIAGTYVEDPPQNPYRDHPDWDF